MAKFVTNASSAIWWPKLEPILIALHVGQIWNQFWWNFWWSNFELIQVEPHTIGQMEPMQVAFYLAGEITQVKESICARGLPLIVCIAGQFQSCKTDMIWVMS